MAMTRRQQASGVAAAAAAIAGGAVLVNLDQPVEGPPLAAGCVVVREGDPFLLTADSEVWKCSRGGNWTCEDSSIVLHVRGDSGMVTVERAPEPFEECQIISAELRFPTETPTPGEDTPTATPPEAEE